MFRCSSHQNFLKVYLLTRMGNEFKIDLEDETQHIHRPLYKLSPLELEEAKKRIQHMLEHGFIRTAEFPYGAPVFFVTKKNGSLQFCIDYHCVNKHNIRNWYPFLVPEEMINRLGVAKVFSKKRFKVGALVNAST